MKKKSVKLCISLLSVMTVGTTMVMPIITNAESDMVENQIELEGITEEDLLPEALTFNEPTLGLTRGYSHPTKNWNGKKYNIPQTSIGNGNYVYTNVYFSGKSSYEYYFKNNGSSTIEIQLKNISSHALYKKITLKKGESTKAKLNTKGNWYAQFKGSKDYVFSGWIQ